MQKRWYSLVNAQTLSDSQTFALSLIGVGKIYGLRVNYKNTNGATSNTVGNLHSMVSKLQVLDGSRVLYSCSMAEAQALNCYRRGQMPSQNLRQDGGGAIDEDAYIDFTLSPDDDTHYLDTSNYTSPQLAFTHSFTISATAGFATGSGLLTVEALLGDSGAPSSQGFLLSKEMFNFTSAASGVAQNLLALDLPYASLLVLSGVSATDPTATLTNFELQINNGVSIPYNRTSASIAAALRDKYGRYSQSMIPITGGTAQTMYFDLYGQVNAAYGEAGPTALAVVSAVTYNKVQSKQTTGETAETKVLCTGYLPYGAFYLPFGDGMDVNDFLNPNGMQRLELDLTQGAAQTVQIVTSQLAAM